MMFDNSPPSTPSVADRARTHLPMALLVAAAVAVAFGVHVASRALVVVAVGHLVLAGLLVAVRARRSAARS